MIKYFLKKFFKILIGDLTAQEKADFWFRFNTLITDVAKATAEGAVRGIRNG